MSPDLKTLLDYAQQYLTTTTAHLPQIHNSFLLTPDVTLNFTLNKKTQRWGLQLRSPSKSSYSLFWIVELRPSLYMHGLRHKACSNYRPQPHTLAELLAIWPADTWTEGKTGFQKLITILQAPQ